MNKLNDLLDAREKQVAADMLIELRRLRIAEFEFDSALIEIGRRWGDERIAVFVAAFIAEGLNAVGMLPIREDIIQ